MLLVVAPLLNPGARPTSTGGSSHGSTDVTSPPPTRPTPPAPVPRAARPSVAPAEYNLSSGWAWSPLSSDAPDGWNGSGFLPLGTDGQALLFGGENATGLSDETLLYNESANRWTSLDPTRSPSPRGDFAFGADPNGSLVVLFGGVTNATTGTTANDTWTYSASSGAWTNVSGGAAPAPREEAAFAIGDGIGLLYGGWAENLPGLGETTYYDTWELNLSTFRWTRLGGTEPSGPGALEGASMIFDPVSGEFLLYGGCYPCSSAMWVFDPSYPVWSEVAEAGTAPPPRMDANWAFDPATDLAILFGGTNGTRSYNDTHFFNVVSRSWTPLTTLGAPSPRFQAAAAYLDVPGNETLLVVGGGSAYYGVPPGSWRLSPAANLTVAVSNLTSGLPVANASVSVGPRAVQRTNGAGYLNDTGVPATETVVQVSALGYSNASEALWMPPGANVSLAFLLVPIPSGTIVLTVRSTSGEPLAGAYVNLTIGGKPYYPGPRITNGSGTVLFAGVPVAWVTLAVTDTGYHRTNASEDVTAGAVLTVDLDLSPLLEISLQASGKLPNGTVVALEFVEVSLNFGPENLTGYGGWLNFTTLLQGVNVLHARLWGFAPVQENVTLNATGTLALRIRLVAEVFPTVTVQVFIAGGPSIGSFVENARVEVAAASPLPIGPFSETVRTGRLGSVTFSPLPGNYTITVSAPGCATNDTVPKVFADPGSPTYLPVGLTPLPSATLDIVVESSVGSHVPIPGALVNLSYFALDLTTGNTSPANLSLTADAFGWTNFSALPQSSLVITGSAPGFLTNRSASYISYGQTVARFTLWLTPRPTVAASPQGLRIVPEGANDVWALFLLPGLGLLGAVVYLSLLRAPSRPSSRVGPGPP